VRDDLPWIVPVFDLSSEWM